MSEEIEFAVIDDSAEAAQALNEFLPVYAEVYAEPPYNEGPDDVASFAANDWPRRYTAPGFRLVLARHAGNAIGFAFGHNLPDNTHWWTGMLDTIDPEITREWPGRTFAIIELAVRHQWRRRGIARQLHDRVVANSNAERATLLVRPEPEASPARHAYGRWGFQRLGHIRPFPGAPIYEAMLRRFP